MPVSKGRKFNRRVCPHCHSDMADNASGRTKHAKKCSSFATEIRRSKRRVEQALAIAKKDRSS